MSKPELLMIIPMMTLVTDQLEQQFVVHRLWDAKDRDALIKEAGPNISAIASFAPGKVPATLIAALPKLKIIAHFGVGYDPVDVAAAAKRGIIITNTPDVLNEEVADTALGLLLMTVRELGLAEQYLRAGHWAKSGDYRLTRHTLRDRKVGILGLGRIGKAIARRVEAFGLPVTYYGRKQQPDVAYRFYSDIVAMARDVDTLIAITPGGEGTKNLINAQVLEALGPRGVVINVARGTVIDETALIAALKAKTIAAAGLDVFWNEPRVNPELITLDNVVLLPHVGSASVHTRDAMGQLVVDNLKAYLASTPPLTPVPETPFKGW